MEQINAYGYFLNKPGEALAKKEFTIVSVADDSVVVEVAGCGLCHTDITFLDGDVKTKQELPIILGHEISGKVVAAGSAFQSMMGKQVIIPAVLPCGECELCKAGRDNICQHQKMPGNDFDGGFSSHISVPGLFLCELPENLKKHELADLSVVADAITTPYQALKRSNLESGNLAIVVGVGGIGLYMVQHAKNAGAKVIAIDVDSKKLEKASKQGADAVISAKEFSGRDLKKKIREIVKANSFSKFQWKVFETSGTAAGQDTAFSLMSFAGTVGIIGFTMDKLNVRLSNIMAFDADVFGNWGCRPEYYPIVVKDVIDDRINLQDNIEKYPLESINEVIKLSKEHKLEKRAIFIP